MKVLDYFDKFGFNDGDDRFLQNAFNCQSKVAKKLNELFQENQMPYRAQIVDYSTGHNPCRMWICWTDSEQWNHRWDDYYGHWKSKDGQNNECVSRERPIDILRIIEQAQKDLFP